MRNVTVLCVAVGAVACASAGTRPTDMGATAHEERARDEDRIAATLGPSKDAEQMRYRKKLAEGHRRAARSLRDAEERACSAIAPEARDAPPFSPARIVTIQPPVGSAASTDAATRVVTLHLRPIPGETPDVLRERIQCAQARAATLGTKESPFAVLGVTVAVRDSADGRIAEFRAGDERARRALLDRFRRYAAGD